MTDDELNEIEARVDAASDGPWYADKHSVFVKLEDDESLSEYDRERHREMNDEEAIYEDQHSSPHNAEFITHAREDVPALVAEVRRLRQENDDLKRHALTEIDATTLEEGQEVWLRARVKVAWPDVFNYQLVNQIGRLIPLTDNSLSTDWTGTVMVLHDS